MNDALYQNARDAGMATPFGTIAEREAQLFTLRNRHGLVAEVSDFGATLVRMLVPDRAGQLADIVHGYAEASGYESPQNPYFGATVGRVANRIARGKFTLDGQPYTLATNNEPGGIPYHLHGGLRGFNRRFWEVGEITAQSIRLSYQSPDGEEGYPGNLAVRVCYTLSDDNELSWEVTATSDAPTPVNVMPHSYWNLSGNPTQSIDDHELTLRATRYLPTNAGQMPTGELASLTDTPLDFTTATRIGERIDDDFAALQIAGGYDHTWVLDAAEEPDGLAHAARVRHPTSGRVMDVLTDQPAIHVYTGNYLRADDFTAPYPPGKNGIAYPRRSALCLETGGFPDAPNHPSFPSIILRPGEHYRHRAIHRFSID